MEITLDKKDETSAILNVKIQEGDYKSLVDQKIKDIRRTIDLPGFRKGKVPASYIMRRYGKGILQEEVLNVLGESVFKYVRESDLDIVGSPLLDTEKSANIDWDSQKEFDFVYEVGMAANASSELPELKADLYKIEISDKEIEEVIENLRNDYPDTIEAEISEKEDMISGTIKNEDESATSDKVGFLLNKVIAEKVDLFVDKQVEDTVNFALLDVFESAKVAAMATGLTEEQVEANTGEFTLTITKITRTEKAKLNQEFFDKLVGKDKVTNEEEFKAEIKKLSEEGNNNEAKRLLNEQLRDEIMKGLKTELPAEFMKKWLLKNNEGSQEITPDNIDAQYPGFEEQMKWMLFRDKFASQEEIAVEQEEVMTYTRNLFASQYQIAGDMMSPEIEGFLNNMAQQYLADKENDNYGNIRNTIMTGKVLDHIRENKADVSEKVASMEEFKKVIESYNESKKPVEAEA